MFLSRNYRGIVLLPAPKAGRAGARGGTGVREMDFHQNKKKILAIALENVFFYATWLPRTRVTQSGSELVKKPKKRFSLPASLCINGAGIY